MSHEEKLSSYKHDQLKWANSIHHVKQSSISPGTWEFQDENNTP